MVACTLCVCFVRVPIVFRPLYVLGVCVLYLCVFSPPHIMVEWRCVADVQYVPAEFGDVNAFACTEVQAAANLEFLRTLVLGSGAPIDSSRFGFHWRRDFGLFHWRTFWIDVYLRPKQVEFPTQSSETDVSDAETEDELDLYFLGRNNEYCLPWYRSLDNTFGAGGYDVWVEPVPNLFISDDFVEVSIVAYFGQNAQTFRAIGPSQEAFRLACRQAGLRPTYTSQGFATLIMGHSGPWAFGAEFVEKTALFVAGMLVSTTHSQRWVSFLTYASSMITMCQTYELPTINLQFVLNSMKDFNGDLKGLKAVRVPDISVVKTVEPMCPIDGEASAPTFDVQAGFTELLGGILKSQVTVSIVKVISLLWTLIFVVPNCGREDMFAAVEGVLKWQTLPERVTSVSSTILQHFTLLATRTQAFLTTGDWRAFLIAESDTSRLEAELTALKLKFDETVRSPNFGLTVASIQTSVAELLPRILLHASIVSDFESKKLVHSAKAFALELKYKLRAQQMRPTPFAVLFTGEPGIGKSKILDLFVKNFSLWQPTGEELDIGNVYVRTPNEKFWSGYKSNSWSITFDDLGQESTKMLAAGTNPVGELLHVINNVPFFPQMSESAEKGTVSVNALLILATTNNPGLNLHHTAACPSATFRRLKYRISPKLKAAFKLNGTNFVDPLKCVTSSGDPRLDIWEFDIEEFQLRPGTNGDYYPFLMNLDSVQFWQVMQKLVKTHFAQQDKSTGFTKYVNDMRLCPTCEMPQDLCACGNRPTTNQAFTNFMSQSGSSTYVHSGVLYVGLIFFIIAALFDLHWQFVCVCNIWLMTVLIWKLEALEARFSRLFTSFWLWSGLRAIMNFRNWCWNVSVPIVNFCRQRYARWMWAQVCLTEDGFVPDLSMRAICARVKPRRRRPPIDPDDDFVPVAVIAYVPWYRRYWLTLVIVMSILAICGSAMLWSRAFDNFVTQADSEPVGPEEKEKPKVDPWFNPERIAVKTTISRFSTTGHQVDIEQGVLESVARIETRAVVGVDYCHCLPMGGQFWLVPAHFIRRCQTQKIGCRITRERMSWQWNHDSEVKFHPNSDYCLISVVGSPSPRHARWVADTCKIGVGQRLDGKALYTRTLDARQTVLSLRCENARLNDKGLVNFVHGFIGFLPHETAPGDCGIPVMSTDGKSIYGIHIGGVGSQALYVSLDGSWIRSQMHGIDFVAQGANFLGLPDGTSYTELTDVPHKCPLRWQPLGQMHLPHVVLGATNTRVQQFKSNIGPTWFAPFWSRYFETVKVRPRVGKTGDFEAPLWQIKTNFLVAASQDRDIFSHVLLQRAVASLKKKFDRLDWTRWRVLDDQEVLYGVPGEPFCRAMKFSTSAGPPYCKSKSAVMEQCNGRFVLSGVQRARIDAMLDRAREGTTPGLMFRATLKDEPVKPSKLHEGKLRIFQASSLEATFLMRKYFIYAGAVLCSNFRESEIAVGMNPHGPQWDELHEHLFASGWNIFCGDYSNFDQNMSSGFLRAAWSLIIGYSDQEVAIKEALAADVSNPLTDFFGDIIRLSGTNPSGHSMTVILNGVVNSLYLRYAFAYIFPDRDDFNDVVVVITYGDDNVVAVHPSIAQHFNQRTVAAALATICVKYTDANKSSVVPEFTPEEDWTFLKRSWSKCEFHGEECYLAPLEMDSIAKMLLIGENSAAQFERHVNLLRASLLEMFHWGEEAYNTHLTRIHELAQWLLASDQDHLRTLGRDVLSTQFDTFEERWMKRKVGTSWFDGAEPGVEDSEFFGC